MYVHIALLHLTHWPWMQQMNSALLLGLHSAVQSLSKDVPHQTCLCLPGTKKAHVRACWCGPGHVSRSLQLRMALPGAGRGGNLDADLYRCSRSLDALNFMISAISSLLFRFRHDFPKLAPKKQQASGHHWHPNFALQHPRDARLIGVSGGGSLEIWSCITGGLDRRSMPVVATSSVAAAIFACVVLPGVGGTIANVIEYRPSSFAVGIKDSVLEPGTRR